ncbi:MAG: hypothetical protein QOE70_3008 [Chthoniobacter sp.]|jgi:hypothetical protein|nr:hypothetical protein [Chthoniobacter sp.]
MVSTKNPFPGMNPFLERTWHPVHTRLINYIGDEIAVRLPEGLVARPEERLAIDAIEPGNGYVPDVGITETWKQGVAPLWTPPKDAREGVVTAEPEILRVDEEIERWIEIRTVEGRVVTVIELLSPANKDTDRTRYKLKQFDYLHSTTSLVEIDLLRAGRFVLPVPEPYLRKAENGTSYYICCSRAWRPGTREVYRCPLRERLPAIRIPLRPTDQDLVLDLQPLIDRCYEVGRYYADRSEEIPGPPFAPDEATWVEERLRTAGLRG